VRSAAAWGMEQEGNLGLGGPAADSNVCNDVRLNPTLESTVPTSERQPPLLRSRIAGGLVREMQSDTTTVRL
jgi:hypothetical protein